MHRWNFPIFNIVFISIRRFTNWYIGYFPSLLVQSSVYVWMNSVSRNAFEPSCSTRAWLFHEIIKLLAMKCLTNNMVQTQPFHFQNFFYWMCEGSNVGFLTAYLIICHISKKAVDAKLWCIEQVWVFSSSMGAVATWSVDDKAPSLSDHLTKCPYYNRWVYNILMGIIFVIERNWMTKPAPRSRWKLGVSYIINNHGLWIT